MKSLLLAGVAAGTLFAATPSHASMVTTGHYGAWETLAGTSDRQSQMCAATLSGRDSWWFHLKTVRGMESLSVQVFKLGWAIPDGQRVRVLVQVDQAPPFNMTGQGINYPGGPSGIQLDFRYGDSWSQTGKPVATELLSLLASGRTLRVFFPDGDESPWEGSLTGSAAALTQLVACDARYANPAAPTQPFAATPAPRQPYVAPPTQPYLPAVPKYTIPAPTQPYSFTPARRTGDQEL